MGRDLSAAPSHGPVVDWEKWQKRRKQACLTVEAELLAWAKERYNLSAVLEQALRTLRGEMPRDAISQRILELEVELAALRSQMADIDIQRAQQSEAEATERAREEAVALLARSFWEGNRESLPPRANLSWAESRAHSLPALRALQPGEVLDLVLARRPREARAA